MIVIERVLGYLGGFCMTEYEKQLISMIRESENPELALLTAVNTILAYLSQPESSAKRAAAVPLAPS